MWAKWGSWMVLALAACQPNSTGFGSASGGASVGDSNSNGDTTGNDDAAATDPDPSATEDSGPGETNEDTTSSDPTDPTDGSTTDDTQGTGTPMLEISDGPTFSYGNVPVGNTSIHVFTVTNVGDGTALSVAGATAPDAFDFDGGAYPGLGGDCGDTLEAGGSCTLAVVFAPGRLGPQTGTVSMTYGEAGAAERPVEGGGEGQSANLLVNGDAESGGSPPTGWSDEGNGNWSTESFVVAQQGSNFIASGSGNNNQPYRLRQSVALDAFQSIIDMGVLRFSFAGYARTASFNDNEYRFFVYYWGDDPDTPLDTWATDWQTGGTWTLHNDIRTAPVGTNYIEVELGCIKSGGTFCDAYYDAMELRAIYP